MGMLLDAVNAWVALQDTTYEFLLGRSKNWSASFTLDFQPSDFPHLAGVHYADDVDFGINRAELHSAKFIAKLLSGYIDDDLIERAAAWNSKIKNRLECIIVLERILDADFLIYKFEQKRVPHGSTLCAEYVIKYADTDLALFVFVDHDMHTRWFCRSVFQSSSADYTINQTRLTVLKKRKLKNGELNIDYTHPNYKEVTCSTRP